MVLRQRRAVTRVQRSLQVGLAVDSNSRRLLNLNNGNKTKVRVLAVCPLSARLARRMVSVIPASSKRTKKLSGSPRTPLISIVLLISIKY